MSPALIARARALAAGQRRVLLGITGAPGAGKTTLARSLARAVPGSRVVGMDGFHLAQRVLDELGRADRKGAIDTFDAHGFVALLQRIRPPSSGVVYAPEFRRELEEPIANAVAIGPETRLVIVEGNYLLAREAPWNAVRSLLDEAWYCERDEERRISDLIARHRAYGKDEEHARRWTLTSDQRNAELIQTTRERADLVVRLDEDRTAT